MGEDFLKDCDGREVILNATEGECILDPDAAARQSAITCICEMQRQNKELNAQLELPNRTRDGEEFELLANCFGPEDVGTAMESGASGVGLLRSSYMMMPGHAMDEQEQYLFYTSCLAAAKGKMVTVRTFDFGADRTMADAYQGVQSPSWACGASAAACAICPRWQFRSAPHACRRKRPAAGHVPHGDEHRGLGFRHAGGRLLPPQARRAGRGVRA